MQINGYHIDDALLKEIDAKIGVEKDIYPPKAQRFRALELTALHHIKVVILGQDPYHGEGQAHGLAFSVNKGVKIPPSLKNIYKELETNFILKMPKNGDLTCWAKQGVLLLNSVLSVKKGQAASHAQMGWEQLTDSLIAQLNSRDEAIIFMLWGAYAQKKGVLIDRDKHHVLETTHPSPFSAYKGFLGCGHFRQANQILKAKKIQEIDWFIHAS